MPGLKSYLYDLEKIRDRKEFELIKLRNEIANVKADIRKTRKLIDTGRDYGISVDERGQVSMETEKGVQPVFHTPALTAKTDVAYQAYCQWYLTAYKTAEDRKHTQMLIYEAWVGQHASANPTSISYTRWRRETGNG
jgi:hypothetical protein